MINNAFIRCNSKELRQSLKSLGFEQLGEDNYYSRDIDPDIDPEMKMEGGRYSRVVYIIIFIVLLLLGSAVLAFGNIDIL